MWDNHVITVPYHSSSNLPILFTVPGGKFVEAYISRHLHAWDGAYFASNDNSVTWDSSLIHGKNKIPEELESTTNFPLINDKSLDDISGTNITSIINEQNSSKLDSNNNKSIFLKNSNQSEKNMSTNACEQTSSTSICGKCKPHTLVELRETKAYK